jgi:hypothetical protein
MLQLGPLTRKYGSDVLIACPLHVPPQMSDAE